MAEIPCHTWHSPLAESSHGGTPTPEGLVELRNRRQAIEATVKSYLLAARAAGKETLTDRESRQFRNYQDQLGVMDGLIEQYEAEVMRANVGNYGRLGGATTR